MIAKLSDATKQCHKRRSRDANGRFIGASVDQIERIEGHDVPLSREIPTNLQSMQRCA